MFKILGLFALLVLTYTAQAQVFTCFDIDTNQKVGSTPTNYTVANGKLFFNATTKALGEELYVSDGTPAGTQLLKDINPGPANGMPYNGVECNGLFFFWALDPVNGMQLWATDGTTNGTYMVANVNGNGNITMTNMIAYNNLLYFVANHPAYGFELWVTDGKAVNTHLVKDVNPGIKDSGPSRFTVFNNKLYFVANEQGKGRAFWETDGTEQGTNMVISLDTSLLWSVGKPVIMNNKLYFLADDTTGMHLWVSDGTQGGTIKVTKDSFDYQYAYDNTIVCNNKLFFKTRLPGEPEKLWVSDGTTVGTKPLVQTNGNLLGGGEMYVFNNKLYFSGVSSNNNNNLDLWKTDGTDTGTHMIYPNAFPSGQMPSKLIQYNNHLYFEGYTQKPSERNLWRTDGYKMELVDASLKSCIRVLLNQPSHYNEPRVIVYNAALYYTAAYDTLKGEELWSFKDTPAVNNIAQQNTTKHNNLVIYPNPNNGDFTLNLPEGINAETILSVYDMMGCCVFAQQITTKNNNAIHLGNVPAGIYQLRLQSDNGVISGRVLIQK